MNVTILVLLFVACFVLSFFVWLGAWIALKAIASKRSGGSMSIFEPKGDVFTVQTDGDEEDDVDIEKMDNNVEFLKNFNKRVRGE